MKDLFELALSDIPRTSAPADPDEDLARGRRLLRRRRQRMAGLAGVTAAVLGGILVPLSLGGSAPAAGHPVTQTQAIKLVAWVGTQPPGYKVDWMPKGWVVQGSDPYALTMAPPNAKDKDPHTFIGKLVVMLQSADASAPPANWTDQPVNGRPGKFDVQGDTQILIFKAAGGQWVDIQAPVSLGWDRAELAKFGGGVTVLGAAQPGRG